MPKHLPQRARDNLDKCRAAAVAAVDAYNRPGPRFRTAHFIVLIVIAWGALFHAIFYMRGRRPWYQKKAGRTAKGTRYVKVDGEPKHWDLAECVAQFFREKAPPERKNLDFLIGLRNKIEHRHLPELDPVLYGECQASLINLEELIVQEFGAKWGLADELQVSLQLSSIIPDEKRKALKTLAGKQSKTVRDYVEKFRGALPTPTLNSMKYSFSVFLVPRVANRESSADIAVQFVKVDEAKPEELDRLDKLNVLIREKHIPIANLGLHKPSDVVKLVRARLPHPFTVSAHTAAWRHFRVRPPSSDPHPERTAAQYCVWDRVHRDYVYTDAWVERLVEVFADLARYQDIVGADRV
jgi:hypothetical protein